MLMMLALAAPVIKSFMLMRTMLAITGPPGSKVYRLMLMMLALVASLGSGNVSLLVVVMLALSLSLSLSRSLSLSLSLSLSISLYLSLSLSLSLSLHSPHVLQSFVCQSPFDLEDEPKRVHDSNNFLSAQAFLSSYSMTNFTWQVWWLRV